MPIPFYERLWYHLTCQIFYLILVGIASGIIDTRLIIGIGNGWENGNNPRFACR